MATAGFLSLTLFLSLHHISAAGRHPPELDQRLQTSNIIHQTCKGSRDQAQCDAWLSQSHNVPPNATVSQVIRSALGLASQNLDNGQAMLRDILNSSAGNANRTRAARICLDSVFYAKYRLNLTDQAVARGSLKDARAWLSAALAYQYGCWGGLKYVNDSDQVVRTMEFFNSTLIIGSSSALGMLSNYDVHGDDIDSWGPPKTERDGFWELACSGSQESVFAGVPPELKEDVTVCKDGGGCEYNTVQDAVNAAPNDTGLPGKRFVIRIRAGVYEETIRIPLEKTNLVLLGDGMGKTVITGFRNAGQQGVTTYESATVGVVGDGFMASGITFQNTAGPPTHQAVAFRSASDRSVIENCEFIGNQDTLYPHSLRQLYKSCRIQGSVDFIFGNAAAVFQDCQILIAPRQENPEIGENNAVTAQGRSDPAQTTGFVFQKCVINGTDAYNALYRANPKVHRNFLGRPWQKYSRTVFLGCTLEALIADDGWMKWSGDFALDTLYYGEFNNTGPGSGMDKRVPWSSRIPTEHTGFYSVENFIQANEWKMD